jgi:hypothetical protein
MEQDNLLNSQLLLLPNLELEANSLWEWLASIVVNKANSSSSKPSHNNPTKWQISFIVCKTQAEDFMPALFFLANAGQNRNGMGSSSKNTSIYKQRPSYINKSITPKHTIPLKNTSKEEGEE